MTNVSMRWKLLLAGIVAIGCGVAAQNSPAPANDTRKIVSAKSGEVADKVNGLAAIGYRATRVEGDVGLSDGLITVLMERATDGPCEYAFVRGSIVKKKLLAGLTDSGSKGFHMVPDSMVDFGRSKELSPPEYGGLMEKCGKNPGPVEFRTEQAMSIGNLQKDIEAGCAEGFRPVMTGFHFVVLEKRAGAAAIAPQSFRYFVVDHVKDAEKKIPGLSDGDYRIAEIHFVPASDYAFGIQESTIVMMLEKTESPLKYKYIKSSEKLDKNDPQGSATRQLKVLMDAMNQAGAEGYRVVAPMALARWNRLFGKTVVMELSAVMERTAERHYEYQFAVADDTAGLYRKLDEASAQGFHLAQRGMDDSSALMEREITK